MDLPTTGQGVNPMMTITYAGRCVQSKPARDSALISAQFGTGC